MQEVILKLKANISPEINIYSINEDNENIYSSEKYNPLSKSSKMTMDINDDLNINNSLMLNNMSNINNSLMLNNMSNIVSLETSNIYESKLSSQNHIDIVEIKSSYNMS